MAIKPHTEVTIVRQREKESPDVYWNVICMSGVNEGKWGELADAESYCNDCGYTYEIDKTEPQAFMDWEREYKRTRYTG